VKSATILSIGPSVFSDVISRPPSVAEGDLGEKIGSASYREFLILARVERGAEKYDSTGLLTGLLTD